MKRRDFLLSGAALAVFAGRAEAQVFEVTRTDAEWRSMLSALEYKVMRKEGTERAFTSPLDKNTARGAYHCRGCDLKLYSSRHKYDSGTGWPSFWKALRFSTSIPENMCRQAKSRLLCLSRYVQVIEP